ncbi:MAG TPA: MFS transporter [Candidatus Limnocylindrales bacterium]|nr:MFS transporter [Candidatus Limnocylindrales bacterium]
MDRSLWAVLGGTFTLRFSTGLTGTMLAVYLAKLPEHGGPVIEPTTLAYLHSAFYISELTLSPLFGILSDRFGHHRMMLVGPVFGAVAVILTGLTTNLFVLGGTRVLEGASTAASVPSILGYIALVTAGNEVLRGKAAARFEGATLAGIGVGLVVAPLLFAVLGPIAFFLNAGIYAISFLIYKYGVEDRQATERADRRAAAGRSRMDLGRYVTLLRSSHVWLLAPTWIAVNASIGLWFSQAIFQFSQANPKFPDQLLHRGFKPLEISLAAVVIGIVFGAGLLFWGNRFNRYRRTTIILFGILGGAVMAIGGFVVNHADGLPIVLPIAAGLAAAVGLFVLAGATPAALGLLADMSEAFPTDRGAIMGLYSVFLGIGQIVGSLIGGFAAEWRGIDGLLAGTVLVLAIALLPLSRLRQSEHQLELEHPELAPEDRHKGAKHG